MPRILRGFHAKLTVLRYSERLLLSSTEDDFGSRKTVKRSLSIVAGISFGIVILAGCGGHEGGQLDIPADNPYQVSPTEEKARAQQRAAAFEARRAAELAAAEAAAAEAEAAAEEPKETPRTSPANAGRPNPTGTGRYAE